MGEVGVLGGGGGGEGAEIGPKSLVPAARGFSRDVKRGTAGTRIISGGQAAAVLEHPRIACSGRKSGCGVFNG